jgi:hypothetical protein
MNYNVGAQKKRIIHPLWTHLLPVALLVAFIAYVISVMPLPAEAPLHFSSSFNGTPNGYGSPWGFISFVAGFSLFFIVLSGIIDEQWARQEKKKSFNWLCWLDALTVGWMVGLGIDVLLYIKSGAYLYNARWALIGGIAGGSLLLSLVMEYLRPYRPYHQAVIHDTGYSETELAQQIKNNTAFIYWDSQNPFWVTLAAILLPVAFIGATVVVWLDEGWVPFVFLFIGLSVVITVGMVAFIYGGLRVTVTRQEFSVRWGLAGVRLLRLKISDIATISLREFAPLRDFGGYGIRFGGGTTAYFLKGTRGVQLSALNGKKYLVGSDHPERLLAVLEQVTGKKG